MKLNKMVVLFDPFLNAGKPLVCIPFNVERKLIELNGKRMLLKDAVREIKKEVKKMGEACDAKIVVQSDRIILRVIEWKLTGSTWRIGRIYKCVLLRYHQD